MRGKVMPNAKVAIIGGGISGLSAAKVLQSCPGIEYRIYEATERIGGRIWTKYLQDEDSKKLYKLEYGANWIHGTENNPVHDIASKNSLYSAIPNGATVPKNSRYQVLIRTESGQDIPKEIHRDVRQLLRSAEKAATTFFSDEKSDVTALNVRPDSSVEHFITETVMKNLSEKYQGDEEAMEMSRSVLRSILSLYCSVNGCDSMLEVSLNQYGVYEELGGSEPSISQGFEKVVQAIAKSIPDENIVLSKPVSHISYTLASANRKKCEISFADGTNVSADACIITSSLGYLKENISQLFSPSLPAEKVKAINKLKIGTVNKIFLQFGNLDFLPEKLNIIHVGLSDESFMNKDCTFWYRKLYSFIVEPTPRKDTLTTWINGSAAVHMETLSDEEVSEGCLHVLRSVMRNPDIPSPRRIIRSRWYSNPYTRGSYSFIPVGATVDDINNLAQPVLSEDTKKPVLLFAGEAAHPKYYSTTHGALLSGQSQAQHIINAYCSN